MTKAEQIVKEINEDWSENWDIIQEFLGYRLALLLEEAYEEIE